MLLTFGLLSPGKGIEYVIRALPEITRQHPELIYIVLGATHPNLVRTEGEALPAEPGASGREIGHDAARRLLQPLRRA